MNLFDPSGFPLDGLGVWDIYKNGNGSVVASRRPYVDNGGRFVGITSIVLRGPHGVIEVDDISSSTEFWVVV